MTVRKREPIKMENIGSYVDEAVNGIENRKVTDGVFSAAEEMIHQDVRDAFNSSVSPYGETWPERKKKGDGHPLLMDTGKLMQAATGGGAGSISKIEGREAEFGVDGEYVEYAAVHQRPVTSPIPQRVYYGATEKTEQDIGELIADDMLDVF